MSEELKACKYCDNAGWYPDYDPHTGEPEAVQCECCYTEPDSVFNKFNQLTSERDALRAENERMRKVLEKMADDRPG